MSKNRRRKLYTLMVINIFLFIVLIACSKFLRQGNMGKSQETIQNPENTGLANSLCVESQSDLSELDTFEAIFSESKDRVVGTTQEEGMDRLSNAESSHEPQSGETPLYRKVPYYNAENEERYANYQQEHLDLPDEKIITYVNIGLDSLFYERVKKIEAPNALTVLVNKYNQLPDDFEPDLVQLDPSLCVAGRGTQYLRKEAAQAFAKMHEDAKREGLNITAYGTYRSISTQHAIWNNAIQSGRTKEDVDSLNSRGGHSEHHTGLAVDVIKNNYSVQDTKEFAWYSQKAHQYGFIIRYPEGKEMITGYQYEPWHLRYVGPEAAADVYQRGLTYEEYYVTVLKP